MICATAKIFIDVTLLLTPPIILQTDEKVKTVHPSVFSTEYRYLSKNKIAILSITHPLLTRNPQSVQIAIRIRRHWFRQRAKNRLRLIFW